MRPGRTVAPGSSITLAALGTGTASAGPTAAMVSPFTSTTQPVCGVAVAASNTRSGLSRIGASAMAFVRAKPESAISRIAPIGRFITR